MTDLERIQFFTHSTLLPITMKRFIVMNEADMRENAYHIHNAMNNLTTGGVAMEESMMDYQHRHYSRLFGYQIGKAMLAMEDDDSPRVYGHCEAAYVIQQTFHNKEVDDAGVFMNEYAELV